MPPETPPTDNPRKGYGERRRDRIDALAAAGTIEETPGVSLIASAWSRLRRNPVFLLGLTITVLFVVLALVSPWLAPYDPADNPLIDQVRRQTEQGRRADVGASLGLEQGVTEHRAGQFHHIETGLGQRNALARLD